MRTKSLYGKVWAWAEVLVLLTVLVLFVTTLTLLSGITTAHAAGSVTVTQYHLSGDDEVLVIKLACIGDSGDGTVPATALTETEISLGLSYNYTHNSYYLWEVWVVAGSPAPDPADIAITDALAAELYSQVGIITASGTSEGIIDKAKTVTSTLTVTVSNQATVSAKWDIYLKLVR